MSQLFYRIIIAVLSVVFIFALLPPVLRVLGLDLGGDVLMILKLCIGAIALFYILKGPPVWPTAGP